MASKGVRQRSCETQKEAAQFPFLYLSCHPGGFRALTLLRQPAKRKLQQRDLGEEDEEVLEQFYQVISF